MNLKALKKGDFFLRKPTSKNVMVKGLYDPASKKYECHYFDDVNRTIWLSGTTAVFTEFEF